MELISMCGTCRYLQERIHQAEDEQTHAMATIAKYKVFVVTFLHIASWFN